MAECVGKRFPFIGRSFDSLESRLRPMLRTVGLAKGFAGRSVLRGVDLEVASGEVFGFIGPNGAGKSTFLKCLVGVVRPDAGEAEVAGVDAIRRPLEVRRRVGYAPGETALYHRMRAGEHLNFAVSFHPDGDRRRGRALLAELGVPAGRRVGRLSHGMKRKLLIAQALACRAPVLLLDEPLAGLDPEARRTVVGLLRREAEAGTTVFLSSHDLAGAERLCDRVAFLRAGRILAAGPVAELLAGAERTLIVELRVDLPRHRLPRRPGWEWIGAGRRWRLRYPGPLERVLPGLAELPLAALRPLGAGLEELFEDLYGPEDRKEQA
ncbi:MAG: ABC transporter ATP-binding protein [Planctomycetota bacterium]|nr:MAG: ABC transporter ATP-binding protein [Planctomycetota bacterium]